MKKMTLLLIVAVCVFAIHRDANAAGQKTSVQVKLNKATGTGPYSTLVNINNLSMWVSYDGNSARNPYTTNAGVTFPRGTSTCIYADGLIWGGLVNDGGSQQLRVNGTTYQTGLVGGKILSKGVAEDPSNQSVRIFRIRRDWETADLTQDAAELINPPKPLSAITASDIKAVRDQYQKDWLEWPADKGAPFYDRNRDGIYTPDPNGHYDASDTTHDEPGVAGADQVVWFVMNDLNAAQSQSFLGSDPIGLEVQVTLWGYARTDALGNVVFKRFRYIYKGTAAASSDAQITNMYVGQWADPDLGDYSDDFEGCDVTKSLGYVYNASAVDGNYKAFGLPPPAAGYDFFAGPLVNAPADSGVYDLHRVYGQANLPMTAWIYFAAGGTYSDPPFSYVGAGQWYNLLRGLTPVTGAPFVYPGGTQTKFWLSGDPVAGTGYLDGTIDAPGDRRMMLSTGPFSMALGDTQEVVVALLAGLGTDRLSSVSVLKSVDEKAQFAYDVLFNLPKPPPTPPMRIEPLDRKLVLNWGYDLDKVGTTENYNVLGVRFEGYNVYQLPSSSPDFSKAVKLATFDLINGIKTIADTLSDPNYSFGHQVILQNGKDVGIKRTLEVTTDAFNGGLPLANGQRYYFAVTAYGYSDTSTALSHAAEAPLTVVGQQPQTHESGQRLGTSTGQSLDLSTASVHIAGSSEIIPKVTIIEPTKITGHTYQVGFEVDTIDSKFKWQVHDNTLSQAIGHDTVLYTSANVGGVVSGDVNDDNRFPIIDGMLFEIKEQTPALKPDQTRWVSPNPVWIEGIRFTGDPAAAFGGGVTTGDQLPNYLSHNATTFNPFFSYPVEVQFGTPQKAYRLRRTGPGASYIIQSTNPFVDVPFSVFDVSNPLSPRQLTVAWRDQDADGTWNPAVDDDRLEIVFILNDTYDPTGTTQFHMPPNAIGDELTKSAKSDVVYGLSLGVISGHTLSESSGNLEIVPFLHLTPNDKFVFTPAKPTQSASLAKSDVSGINVFPNPYYGYNRQETSRFARFVTFNHLPLGDWKIRIFNLAGTLVKVINPTDNGQTTTSQYATWDLNNQSGLPVASGIYVAYIEMSKVGATKILKIAIIQEQQVLDFY